MKTRADYTGKIDNYKPFKFLLKFALWHDFLVHFSFCIKSALILSTYKHVLNDNKKECHKVFTYLRISA